MWWWVLTQALLLQVADLSAHEEVWGESTQASVTNWQDAREKAQDAGLEAALRSLWDARVAPVLFMGVPNDTRARVQKELLARRKSFLIGLSGIQENRLSGGGYTFRALYKLDVAGVLRETKLLFLVDRKQTLHLRVDCPEPARTAAALQVQLQRPGLAVLQKTDKAPAKCPADFCLQATCRRLDEGWEAQLSLQGVMPATGAGTGRTARNDRKPTVQTLTSSVQAATQEELFLQLPGDLLAALGVAPTIAVQLQTPATLDFVSWMQVLLLIQRQEPEVVGLRTIGLLSDRNTAVFHVRQAPGGRDVWFKGLYLGRGVTVTWKKRVDGVFEMQIQTTQAPADGRLAP
jgi:hypothetical protein